MLHVRRSHERERTKTGEPRTLPLLPAIAGDVLEAVRLAGGSGLLFPSANGGLQRRDTKLSRVLRAAMVRAGVGTTGVTYKCRRPRCGVRLMDGGPVREMDCPTCGMRLWPVAHVRAVRWYDLRHVAATLHRQAGADPVAVSTLLGHSRRGASTTENVYTHLDVEYLRAQLTRWHLAG